MATKITPEEQAERDAAIERLRKIYPEGSRVPVVIRKVSQNGSTRSLSPLYVAEDGCIYDASWIVARAGIFPFDDKNGGVKVRGNGMDMVYHLVYRISVALYGYDSDGLSSYDI